MFGTWGANTNTNTATNNNPAQPAAGGFGTTNAFGQPAQNTGGFGGFGQPQQPQQPASGFGATTTNTGFGAFGGGSNAFGQKPANAFGASTTFGAAPQTGGGGFGTGFGANPTTTTNAFGQPAANTASTSTFGTGFGATTTNSAWGKPATTTTTGFGTMGANATPQGTANPPFSEVTERDSGAANITLHYHSISCMPQYIKWSPEELRVQDYAVGRKNASSNVPAAPQAGGFGGTTPATTGFGNTASTNAFGQPAANAAAGGFGAFGANTNTNTNTGTGLFGATTNPNTTGFTGLGGATNPTTNAFGQPAANPASNPFGANTNTATGFGGFGSNTPTNTAFGATNNATKPFGGAFGATNTPTATGTGFGTGFGATNNNAPATNAFGQPATNNAFGGFGGANNNAPKPTGFGTGFGTTNTTTNAFGQPAAGTNAFGQPNQPAAGGFGANTNTAGAGTGFGAFGQQNVAQATNPFGQPAQNAPSNPFGGGFGQPAGQQANTATGGFGANLFGNKPATTTATGFGAFGQPANQGAGAGATGLTLGTGTTGNNLFGTQNNNTGLGLFGQNKPTGLLGTTTTGNPFGGGGGFGGSTLGGNGAGLGLTMQANPAQVSTTTNPFGAFGGFAQPSTTTGATAGSNLFGASSLQPQPQQQPSLTASVDQPFNSAIPVFELLPGAAALAGSLAASSLGKKKAPNFFQTRKALPSAKLAATLTSSSSAPNLRGFAASTANGKAGLQGLTQMMRAGTNNSTSALGSSGFLGGALSEKKALNSEVFVNSPGGRTSVKKLILDKEVSGTELSSLISKNSANKKNTGSALELFRGSPSTKGGLAPKALPAPPPVETSREQTHTESDRLEKGDYWIQPSEAQLAAIAFKDLEKLEGFKCGRVGYGTVEFLEPVNLTTIGAVKEIPSKFIIFDQRECTVYPDEQEKPDVGQGLNVPARITLENCWAVDRATREPIKDEEHPRYAAHLKKLKGMPNTAFEKFDIKTGEWTFRVEHFSRYGLGEDDDDEEMPEQTQQTGGQHSTDTAPALVDTSMASIEQSTDDDDENMRTSVRPRDVSMRRSKEPTPAGFRRRSTSRQPRPHVPGEENDADDDGGDTEMDATSPDQERAASSWPAQLGMDPRRVGAMQNSLFAGVPNGGARSKSTGVGKALIKPPPRASTPSALGKHPRELALLEDDVGLGVMQRRRQSVERPSFAIALAEQQDRQLVLEPPARKFVRVVKESLVRGKEDLYRDAGLAFGRSFRVGWGPGGTLVHLGALCGPFDSVTPPESLSVVTISQISTSPYDEEAIKDQNREQLLTYIDHINVVTQAGIPKVEPMESLSFQPFAALFRPQDDSFEATLWRLASALFDPIPSDVPTDINAQKAGWISDLRRKMKIGDWLQAAVAHSVEEVMLDGSTTPIAQVFALLSGNQVQRACEVAMDAGDFHLATLISQIGGDKRFRETMFRQWATWVNEKADVFIDEGYRRVYALLAGEATTGIASKSKDPFLKIEDVDITKDLDWKRVFSLHFWYSCRVEDPASTAVELYNLTTGSETPTEDLVLFNPPPWYASKVHDSWLMRWGKEGDALLHLLRLFQNPEYSLADALSPRSYSPNTIDYRLPWQLYTILCGLGLFEPANSHRLQLLGDKLTIAYAMQLENEESIDSAVFVLLHLNEDLCRASAVKSILMRNAHLIDDSCISNLVTFSLPTSWIAAAKAAYARYQGKPYLAYNLYLDANEQKFACDIAIADLAPDAIIRHDHHILRELFESFNPEKIDDWAVRGKLFLDYVDVMQSIPKLIDAISAQPNAIPTPEQSAKADRIFATIPNLLRLLPPILGSNQDPTHDMAAAHVLQSKRHKAALDEVVTGLVYAAGPLETMLQRKPNVRLDLRGVEPGARLQVVQSAAYDRFCNSLEVLS